MPTANNRSLGVPFADDGIDAERRRATREPRGNPVRVCVTGRLGELTTYHGRLVNIGYGGALVNSEASLEPGQACEVTIIGDGGFVAMDRESATVKWVQDGEREAFTYGIEFAVPQFRIIE